MSEYNPLLEDEDQEEEDEYRLPTVEELTLPSPGLPPIPKNRRNNGLSLPSHLPDVDATELDLDEELAIPEDEDLSMLVHELGLDGLEEDDEEHGEDTSSPEYKDAWSIEDDLGLVDDDDEEEDLMGGINLDAILAKAIDVGASDVDIIANDSVSFEVRGDMHRIEEFGILVPEITTRIQLQIISHVLEQDFVENLELDTAYVLKAGPHKGRRMRLSVGKSFGDIFLVFRVIADQIPTPEALGVPEVMQRWCELPNGLVLICGPTGSGKALGLSTPLPTPTGWTTMGDVRVGDKLLSSQGKATTVTSLSAVEHAPSLYRVCLSDGQEILADANHQWIVADHASRNDAKHWKTKRVQVRRTRMLEEAERIFELGDGLTITSLSSRQIHGLLTRYGLANEFKDSGSVLRVLNSSDLETETGQYNTKYFNGREAMQALSARLLERLAQGPRSIFTVLTTEELLDKGLLTSGRANFAIQTMVADQTISDAQLPIDPYILGVWLGDGNTGDGRIASGFQDEEEMRSILADVWPGAITRRESGGGVGLTLGRPNSSQCVRSHPYLKSNKRCSACDAMEPGKKEKLTNGSLGELLGQVGLRHNKHIPVAYLRASFAQRLSLLQGLMDTDGSIQKNGHGMGMGFSHEPLARGALELVRSLGIKATIRKRPAGYKERDGVYVSCKDSYSINFVTSLPVFRLQRKLDRVLSTVGPSQKWIYIKDIEVVKREDPAYEPVRCITVDSHDASYLCESFVVTHNSTTFASMIRKIQLERPQKIITIEKPIEYVYGMDGLAVIVQREVGRDARTFSNALKSAMRQHPKIIMVGEVRDQEEVDEVLRAAETGHLALTTLHATSPPGAINRIMSLYEGEDRLRILSSLKDNVRGIANQTLVKTKDGKSRFALHAILDVTPEVSAMIGDGDVESLQTYMRERGLTMEHQLAKAVKEGRCHLEDARAQAAFPTLFDELVSEI